MKGSVEEKLKQVKEEYTGKDNKRIISQWEKNFKKLIQREEYVDMEPTKELIKKCEREIRNISQLLAYDESLDIEERKALFRQREIWERILSLFNPKKLESIRESMEKWLDDVLRERS